jgi:hypothetical protein
MSISTPQGGSSKSDPGSIRVTGKSANAAGKPGAGKATGGQRPGAPRPSGSGNRPGGPRRPITPVVAQMFSSITTQASATMVIN